MKLTPQKITLYGILVSAALVISVAEGWFFAAFFPIPGLKLGLANIITLFALYFLGPLPALIILLLRCALASLFGGGVTAFLFSVTGGMCALGAMALLKRWDGRAFTLYGVSIAGAAAHGLGQIFAAMLVLGTASVLYYLPILLLSGIVTGALTGFLSTILFRRLRNIHDKIASR